MSNPILPKTRAERIAFFLARNATWATNAVAIGTTTTAVTAHTTNTDAAQAAYEAHLAAQAAAKVATQTFYTAAAVMTKSGSDIIKQVKTKAALAGAGGNAIYGLALLPVPATPSPAPAPGQPTDFKVAITADGWLELAWKCANPGNAAGPVYQVSRRSGPDGDFAVIGASGTKGFIDGTVPSGVPSVTYRVVAQRSTAAGPSATFTVQFGVATGGGGAVTASIVQSAPKLAA